MAVQRTGGVAGQSSSAEARAEIARLSEAIRRHNTLYYRLSAPEVSDAEYDALFERLRALEGAHPDLVRADSPTQGVEVLSEGVVDAGEGVAIGPKGRRRVVAGASGVGADAEGAIGLEGGVEHLAPMLSLDSAHDLDAVGRFHERVLEALDGEPPRYVLEPKLDGASVELVYRDGALERAVTRGDGRAGEDVTHNVMRVRSVPRRLAGESAPVPREVSIRGEVIMCRSDFGALNEERARKREEAVRLAREEGRDATGVGPQPYKNPRNVASGALRQLEPDEAKARRLTVLAFDVLAVEGGEPLGTHTETLAALGAWGLLTPERVRTARSVDEIAAYHGAFEEDRDGLDYEIDGVVAKLDDLAQRERLGSTSHHPRWALAYKFPPRRREARVAGILTQVGRTGVLTPVARLEAVWPEGGFAPEAGIRLGGVLVSRASLHNREEVERKDIREGDRVLVQRAGDVIPQVVARVEEEGVERGAPYRMPSACPACGAKAVDRGPFRACPDHFGCPAQLKARIAHFASRHAFDIEGLAAKTIDRLVDSGVVSGVADLFDLAVDDLAPFVKEGKATQWRRNLVAAIQARREVTLDRFLVGLGVPHVGAAVARSLAHRFGELEALRAATVEGLQAVQGVGPIMAEAIRGFLDRREVVETLAELEARGVRALRLSPLPDVDAAADEWRDKRVVLTGRIEGYRRRELASVLVGLGARVTGTVTGQTDLLVAGANPGRSKVEKATELGVELLDERGLRERLGRSEAATPATPAR